MEELLKYLEWHHLLFVFATICTFIFKQSLIELISRIRSINRRGIKITNGTKMQKEIEKKDVAHELIRKLGNSVILQSVSEEIREKLHEKELHTEEATTNVLIEYLAANQILVEFEQIYSFIFGSQIFLLKILNQSRHIGLDTHTVQLYYSNVQKRHSENFGDTSLDDYLGFLLSRNLIYVEENKFYLSDLGVEFLTWMARNGRSEDKPL